MIKLNIAAGPNIFPHDGWVNYDREGIDEYLTYMKNVKDLSRMPLHQQALARWIQGGGSVDFRIHDIKDPFYQHPDNTVDMLCGGQCVEHFNPIYETPQFLKECYRILKPGGLIRLTTPDLDLLIQAYLNNGMDKFADEQPEWYRTAEPSAQLAYIMYGACGPNCHWNSYEGHMFLFTKSSMTAALKEAGFIEIEFYYESGKSKDPTMQKECVDAGMSHSFIVEAVKPGKVKNEEDLLKDLTREIDELKAQLAQK